MWACLTRASIPASEGRPTVNILPNNLLRQYQLHAAEYEQKALEVLRGGWYILGNEVSAFEAEWAAYIGAKHCVGLASGLDALEISFALLGLGPGDEVIVSANAYIACVLGITRCGATPVFVEPDEYYNIDAGRVEAAVTPRTRAILAVHLFGQSCDMTVLTAIARRHSLYLVEDCAQSHGNRWGRQTVGTFGNVGCFSFYPTKGCGAFGDAGAIVTDDDALADRFRVYRNYGSRVRYHNEVRGANSRLDELQAGLLRVKLTHLNECNAERCRLAAEYDRALGGLSWLQTPRVRPGADSTWHQYVIRTAYRDALAGFLQARGVGTLVHYPIPPHLSEAYADLGYRRGDFPLAERQADEVLSLPLYNGMTEDEQAYAIEQICAFHPKEA